MNTEVRFVAACKSLSPRQAVLKVYEQDYLDNADPYPYLAVILSQIVEKYQLTSITDLLNEMSPGQEWLYRDENSKGDDSWFKKVTYILISCIRLSPRGKFDWDTWTQIGQELENYPRTDELWVVPQYGIRVKPVSTNIVGV